MDTLFYIIAFIGFLVAIPFAGGILAIIFGFILAMQTLLYLCGC